MEDARESRFAHLLQPIRELARNWSIDIATSLEDYLEDLSEITFAVENEGEGSNNELNFAEAALLIQGSTSIYGRKVEHLYSLVLKTLEVLSQRSNGVKCRNTELEGVDNGDEHEEIVPEDEFVLLDDKIEEGKNINMDLNQWCNNADELQPSAAASNSSAKSISLPCPLLMDERRVVDRNGSSFYVSSCTIGHNGTLLLQHGDEWEKENERKSERRLTLTEVVEFADQEQDNSICILGDGNSSCVNDENDGDNIWNFQEDEDPAPLSPTKENSGRNMENSTINMGHSFDWWKPLDPHDPGLIKSRPFRKGRTCKLQYSVGGGERIEAKRNTDVVDKVYWPAIMLHLPLTGVSLPEFLPAQRQERKRRVAVKRLEQKRQAVTQMTSATSLPHEDDELGADVYDVGGDCNDGLDDDDDLGFDGGDFGSLLDDVVGSANIGPQQLDEVFQNDAPESYEATCRRHLQAFMSGADAYARETHLSRRVDTWQGHLEPLLKEQESRKPFDIYATEMALLHEAATITEKPISISHSSNKNEKTVVPFQKLVAGHALFEEGGSEEAHKEKSMNEFKVRVLKIEAPEIGA